MSTQDDVDREALHDWLDVRRDLAADERPDRADYEDEPVCMYCGAPLLRDEGPACLRCEPDGSALVETLVCLAGMAVWLWIAFIAANAFGAWLAG